jgi:D-cysteine desulfhydrase family pyridoxal phosphate-dependent enzyme
MLLDDLPRLKLAHLPTPIEELESLSSLLGGPRIFIKRDDCTGLATGGNKTRKLEYILGDAKAGGADTVITEGGVQSNHCRQTAAASSRIGMDCVLVLNRGHANEWTGNLLLDQILGARIVLVDEPDEREAAIVAVGTELRAQAKNPYVIPTGGSNGVGAMGYANFMREVRDQSRELGCDFDVILTASGSGGTQGGLILGREIFGSRARIVGISDGEPRAELARMVLGVAHAGASLLEMSIDLSDDDISIYDEYFGEGYGVPTPEMVEALRTVARSEGILLDPVYSGKAMAGLIDLIRSGVFDEKQNILFVHTGGTPALFAYPEIFAE